MMSNVGACVGDHKDNDKYDDDEDADVDNSS